MQARLYIDEDAMDDDLVQALRLRGADVQTAFEAELVGRPDEEHLAHAAEEGRVLYTFNVGDFMHLHGGECSRRGRISLRLSGPRRRTPYVLVRSGLRRNEARPVRRD